MDLRKRLALHRQSQTEPTHGERSAGFNSGGPLSTGERLAQLRARLDRLSSSGGGPRVEPTPPPAPPEPFNLPCARRETEAGTLYVIDHRYDWEHCHGNGKLVAGASVNPDTLAELTLDGSLAAVDPSRFLYVDTETTGLMGGTGTLAFLIGLGWFEDGAFRAEQLVLTRPGRELPMLRRLAERMAVSSGLVTYNGKSFDWPLLRNRFVLNRMRPPPVKAHVDLLHCARRALKYRLPQIRLLDVETEILDFHRVGDVDGGEIPELYWQFLRTGDGAALTPVFEHNAHDVVALAAILGRLVGELGGVIDVTDPRVSVGYATIARRNQKVERALAFARTDVANLGARELVVVADEEKRAGNFAAAAELLEAALVTGPVGRQKALVHLGLTKLYEHRLKDLQPALEHAKKTRRVEGKAKQAHRIARLERKLSGKKTRRGP